jgi:hypothetical protein
MSTLEPWPELNYEIDDQLHALHSIAVSLKRIADKIAPRDPREVKTPPKIKQEN